jgi:hypothetical protein
MLYNENLQTNKYDQYSLTLNIPTQYSTSTIISYYPTNAIDTYFQKVDRLVNDLVKEVIELQKRVAQLEGRHYDSFVIMEVD